MEKTTSTSNLDSLICELAKGRECTKQLQNLLHLRVVDDEPVLAEDLVMKIIGSFSDSLSMFSSWKTGELCSSPTTTNVGSGNYDSSSDMRGKKPAVAVKKPRGCYKRRTTEDSRVTIAYTYEDEYAWRKYGQKNILDAKFPRCYYKCTHKDKGCNALKHVQELEDGSGMFSITYFGTHTCQDVNKNIQMFSDPDDHSLFLINFEDLRIKNSPSSLPTIANVQTTPSIKQENDSNAQNGDYLASASHDTSSMYVWEDMLNSDLSYDDMFENDELS
ncbi:WRKY DNA-binding transcription factor 70-like [Bidens hawaiensis]|uniref:WRKY DNA-binding transcription factor 70-like n=1 Tax=Bidens hawaiensis TaxID=980011 RepID=UPI00404B55FC